MQTFMSLQCKWGAKANSCNEAAFALEVWGYYLDQLGATLDVSPQK